ncbi:MAG TPA: c-type cytochrome [Nitrospiria bacterium]|nr:c-type cytochrome [Nitrospiria bacterium]
MVKHVVKASLVVIVLAVMGAAVAKSAEKDPLAPRVPPDQIAAAKATKNPYQGNAGALAEGKAIFEGKGTCFTCHGMSGKGDGPAATGLDPSPRNFTNPAFHTAKTPGEMMWVLKNGSAGTAMIPVVGAVITEDEGWKAILYERSLGGEKP